jgi:LmbE family N-acetylglucosaminyl deacetylase
MHVADLTDVMKYDCLFLSPHLDDIALSCPARVLEEVATGKKVLIATLFSHPGPADAGKYKAADYVGRREEDRKAAEILRADTLHAGMLDAPFRSDQYRNFTGLMFKRDTNHAQTMMNAADYIARLIERAKPDTVFCPLGVGWHIDHRLTREAAMVGVSNFKWRALENKNIEPLTPEIRAHSDKTMPRMVFYEDRPYAFVQESVRLRLAELGFSADAHDLPLLEADEFRKTFIDSFMAAPYVKKNMQPDENEFCLRHLNSHLTRGSVQQAPQAQVDVRLYDRITQATVRRAVSEFRSQIEPLFGDIEVWQRQTQDYSRLLGFSLEYVERYWHLP